MMASEAQPPLDVVTVLGSHLREPSGETGEASTTTIILESSEPEHGEAAPEAPATPVEEQEPAAAENQGEPAAAGAVFFTPPRWIPDDQATTCLACHKAFDMARRRHHCRLCGQVFCYACSSKQSLLPRSFGTRDPQRVCSECHEKLMPLQEGLIATLSNSVKTNHVSTSGKPGLSPYLNKPISFTLGAEVRKAAYSVLNFMRVGVVQDSSIPTELLAQAKGLAFITVLKAGMLWVGSFGTGLVVARLPKERRAQRTSAAAAAESRSTRGAARSQTQPLPAQQAALATEWSAPSAIGTISVGWGVAIGANVTDLVLVLNTDAAVEAFCGAGQVSLGSSIGIAAGPIGRTGAGAVTLGVEGDVAPILSYSHSRGLFAGVSLEGAVIAARTDVNRAFYGRDVSAKALLSGDIDPPPAAAPLYEALAEVKLATLAVKLATP